MSSTLRAVILVLLVASCGVARYSPPRNLDNACSILAQRPAFDRAFQAVKRNGAFLFTYKWRSFTKKAGSKQTRAHR